MSRAQGRGRHAAQRSATVTRKRAAASARVQGSSPAKERLNALDALAVVCCEIDEESRRLELLHFAMVGLTRTAASLKVPHDELEGFLDPIANELAEAYMRVRDLSRKAIDISLRLRPRKRGAA